MAVVVAAVTLTAAVQWPGTPITVHAQTGSLIRPRDLALPASIFPSGSRIERQPLSDQSAEAASKLHAVPFDQLARHDGYVQRATWTPRGTHSPLSIQYLPSQFNTPADAVSALGDARASLWELGRPGQSTVFGEPAISIDERDGHRDVFAVMQHGPLEIEVRLRYGARTPAQAVNAGLWYLHRVAGAADALARRVYHVVPPAISTPTTPPAPFVAPWGAGPVVKSPSLIVPDSSQVPSNTRLDSGSFRPASGPPMASRARRHAALVPHGHLARFAESAIGSSHAQWYAVSALYSDVGEATHAYQALVAANDGQGWLHRSEFQPAAWQRRHLDVLNDRHAWQGQGETVVAVRTQNVILIFAGFRQPLEALAPLVDAAVANVPTWLSARGTSIVGETGDPVHPAALNWYGAEQLDFVVGGLDYLPYQTILQNMKSLGYTTVRLPFSNQLVEQNPIITSHLAVNPELAGLHALDILDRIIAYAGALGMSAILDNHRSDAGWSSQDGGLWYTPAYPDSAFVHDWSVLAARYAVNNVVVGADLRNEPHGSATWGDGNVQTDWRAAAQRAGNAILAANSHVLVIVEGVQFYANATSYWWGGNLMGVQNAPVVLQYPDGSPAHDRLVYSAHDYGPDNCGTGCPWFSSSTTPAGLVQIWEQYWGYITDDPSKSYAAPVWLGEFGTCNYQAICVSNDIPGSQGQWFQTLVQYIGQKHLAWAYWSANGTESTAPGRTYGTLDWYGFFNRQWNAPIPWIEQTLRSIQ